MTDKPPIPEGTPENEIEAWENGWSLRLTDCQPTDCPYGFRTAEYAAWMKGLCSQNIDADGNWGGP